MRSEPFVTVVIPCRNESRYIEECLRSLAAGDYSADRIEFVVADGMSEDGTRETLLRLAIADPRIRMVDNPELTTPAALNRAVAAARGVIIVRMDAHAKVSANYVRLCVERLCSSGADNVGGVMHTVPRGEGLAARAIAAAISHPFGVGDSPFRVPSVGVREVDTVFGGCYRRDVFDRIGSFNEKLRRGQDMEFNLRLARAGGRILLDPAIESWYYARSEWGSFVRHNWSNGVWALLPFAWSIGSPVRPRHLVPLGAAALGIVLLAFSPRYGWASSSLAALVAAYFALALASAAHAARERQDPAMIVVLPVAFVALHVPYGTGSLWGLARVLAIKVRDGGLASRVLDVVVAGTGLVLLAPVLAVCALLVRRGGEPVLYRGERIGRGNLPFLMLKFRTMIVDAERAGGTSTADDDPRISGIGKILRRWKLDELPQLWNVIVGDMSLVGPRPQVRHDVDKYSLEERIILSVRPGITDWSSIRFRNEGEILKGHADPDRAYIDLIRPEKIRLQLHYVRNRSFVTDLKILWATFLALAGREVKLP